MTQAYHHFYHHQVLPFVEVRHGYGGNVCYAKHTHNSYSFGVVLRGQANYTCRAQTSLLTEGQLALIAPDIPHACNPIQHAEWEYLMFYVQPKALAGLALIFTHHAIDDKYLYQLLVNLFYCISQPTVTTNVLMKKWLAIYQHLQKNYQLNLNCFKNEGVQKDNQFKQHINTQSKQCCTAEKRAQTALTWLKQHTNPKCTQTVTVTQADWANAVNLSSNNLRRCLKQSYQYSPHQYVLNQRIHLAKKLLHQNYSLADIAYQLGFADQAHFQRTFKRFTAITPQQYQQEYHIITTTNS